MNILESISQITEYIKSQNEPIQIEIDEDTNLIEAGLIDSLKIMHLIVIIENLRGSPINLEDISLERLTSIKSIKDNFFLKN